MKGSKFIFLILFLLVLASCEKEGKRKLNIINKVQEKANIIAKIVKEEIREEDLFKGMESDIYEAEKNLYDLKYNRLKTYAFEKFIDNARKETKLSREEYVDKNIAKISNISESQIADFIKERGIPKEHINDELRGRIKTHLVQQMKKKSVEMWLAEKIEKTPIDFYVKKPERPIFEVKANQAPSFGGKNAKIEIVSFSDFQCPFCSRGAKVLHELQNKYGNKLKIVFKHFPLPSHRDAKQAAMASMCINELGEKKFWAYHDLLFDDQKNLGKDQLLLKAKKVGANTTKFEECLNTEKYKKFVESDIDQGKSLGVKSTPTFYINGRPILGALSLEDFSEVVEEFL